MGFKKIFFSWVSLEEMLISPLMKAGDRGAFAGRSFTRAQLPAAGKSKLRAALVGQHPPGMTGRG